MDRLKYFEFYELLIRLIKALERILFHGGLNNNELGTSVIGQSGRPGSQGPDERLVKLGEATPHLPSTLMQLWWNLDTICCLAFRLLSVSDHCKS